MPSWIPSMTGWEDHAGVFSFEPVLATWGPNRLDIVVRGGMTTISTIRPWMGAGGFPP
jgi:hypothetical protein